MARMLSQFNAKDNEKMGDFTPIAAGIYLAQIVKSEMKETKDSEGHYLELRFQILEGEHNNRIVFERLNLQNKNVQTVEIAAKTLATICEICGVDLLDDSEQLHNIPMNIKVVIKAAKAQYAEQNEIKGYEKCSGVANIAKEKKSDVATPTGLNHIQEKKTSSASTDGKKTPPWKK